MLALALFLGFTSLLALAAGLGLTADSRTDTYSYPAGPDIGEPRYQYPVIGQ
jgi:hypothetical protein